MNTRKIPALIMLLAGFAACIATYFNHYSFKDMLIVLIIVLVVFLIIGLIVKGIFDAIHLPGEDAVSPDGEVVEKSEEEMTTSENENETESSFEGKVQDGETV